MPGVSTTLSAKIWLTSDSEPVDWDLTYLSSTAVIPEVSALQGITGGFAVDVYNTSVTEGIFIDDIEINEIIL
ncbi:hypothetical protein HRU45_02985 [Candidatus Dependentiae bacterium]|nr:hypothetical protein [Candidatus Dependentiae bacterium]